MENNTFEVYLDWFELRGVFCEVIEIMKIQTDLKNINLSMNINENVPIQIFSDKKRLKQVLYNLIGNAVKFTLNGAIKVYVEIRNNTELFVQVKDSGFGISEENIKQLFKYFGKLKDLNKINQSGMGLGLSICKGIVQKLGGTIEVNSQEGRGSVFQFAVPFKE